MARGDITQPAPLQYNCQVHWRFGKAGSLLIPLPGILTFVKIGPTSGVPFPGLNSQWLYPESHWQLVTVTPAQPRSQRGEPEFSRQSIEASPTSHPNLKCQMTVCKSATGLCAQTHSEPRLTLNLHTLITPFKESNPQHLKERWSAGLPPAVSYFVIADPTRGPGLPFGAGGGRAEEGHAGMRAAAQQRQKSLPFRL